MLNVSAFGATQRVRRPDQRHGLRAAAAPEARRGQVDTAGTATPSRRLMRPSSSSMGRPGPLKVFSHSEILIAISATKFDFRHIQPAKAVRTELGKSPIRIEFIIKITR